MTPAEAELRREAAVLGRYLAGREPEALVVDKYVAAHAAGVVDPAGGARAFDRWLVRAARGGPRRARWVDGWAVVFARAGLLRRKLVLLLAILETSSRGPELDRPDAGGGAVGFALGMGARGVLFALRLALASLVLFPARWVLGGRA